jgi:4'-phosphopantetheinyl transferase
MSSRQDEIQVSYCLTSHLDDTVIRGVVEHLSSDERARHDRFVFARDGRDFAIAHALLRRSLSEWCACAPHELRFAKGPHGKPALEAEMAARTGVSFNLAHTDGLVACVVARNAEVGIDVEAIARRVDAMEVAGRFFSPAEVAELGRCAEDARQARFIETWTLKEAFVKALGKGLLVPLDEFAFLFEEERGLRFESNRVLPPAAWNFALFAPSERHRMAVVTSSTSGAERRLTVRADPFDGRSSRDGGAPLRTSTDGELLLSRHG